MTSANSFFKLIRTVASNWKKRDMKPRPSFLALRLAAHRRVPAYRRGLMVGTGLLGR